MFKLLHRKYNLQKDKYRISFCQTLSICHKQSQIKTDIFIDTDILLEGHFQGLFKNDYP